MAVELVRHRFTTEEYYQMMDAGILAEDDRVELIEGEIIEMAAIGFHHAACVNRINNELLVFTQPAEIGYKQQTRLQKGDTVSPQALSFTLPVADILI